MPIEPPTVEYRVGHVLDELPKLDPKSVQVCVTSPPYVGARLYKGMQTVVWGGDKTCSHDFSIELAALPTKGNIQGSTNGIGAHPSGFGVQQKDGVTGKPDGEAAEVRECGKCGAVRCALGREPLHDCLAWALPGKPPKPVCARCYTCHLRVIGRALWPVLRDDGVWLLNLGDGFVGGGGYWENAPGGTYESSKQATVKGFQGSKPLKRSLATGLKAKDLYLVPERVALALQADGWYVRQKITWMKLSGMPEPAHDRPANGTELIWELTKTERYYFDMDAVREKAIHEGRVVKASGGKAKNAKSVNPIYRGFTMHATLVEGRTLRNYWLLGPEHCQESHVAAFPSEIPRRAIKSASSEWGACSDCGAPWRRNVQRVRPDGWKDAGPTTGKEKELRATSKAIYGGNQKSRSISDIYGRALKSKRKMLGWVPTCTCRGKPDVVTEACLDCDGSGKVAGEWDMEAGGVGEPEGCEACDGEGVTQRDHWPDQKVLDDWPRRPCVILDPFCGSGTTLRVARELGRSSIGIDLSEKYRDEAEASVHTNTKPLENFIGDGSEE